MSDTWGDILGNVTEGSMEEVSWETILTQDERQGGPSEYGNSKYAVYEQCPYKYYIQFVLRMKSDKLNDPLEIGGLFHECKAHYYLKYNEFRESDMSDEDLDIECEKAIYGLLDRAEKVTPRIASDVRRLVTGWMKVHGPGTRTDDRNTTLLVEPLIEVDKGFKYSTRLDRVFWDEKRDGPVIMETKTASRKSEDLLASYVMDGQFLGQQYCWRNSHYYRKFGPLKAFVVDLIVKTAQLKMSQEIVPINLAAIRDWEKQKRYTYKAMMVSKIDGYWPRMRSNCVKYGKPCQFRKHCGILGRGKAAFAGFRKKRDDEY